MSDKAARFWRDDGVINYIIPRQAMTITLMMLGSQHNKWLCIFMEELSSILSRDDVEFMGETMQRVFDLMKQGLAGHTGMEIVPRINEGTADEFDGYLIGTMHPTELASLGIIATSVKQSLKSAGLEGDGEGIMTIDVCNMWESAAKKFVRPSEVMGAIGSDQPETSM